MLKDQLDKCPLEGDLPDGTCKYVGRAREGYGRLCTQHDYRFRTYSDPYATPLSPRSKEPTYEEISNRRDVGDLNRNI